MNKRQAVMGVKEFMATKPESLAARQHDMLKQVVIARLREIASLLEQDLYEVVRGMVQNSPAGDGMGCDNQYISFDDIIEDKHDGSDIGTMINRLEDLLKIQKGGK